MDDELFDPLSIAVMQVRAAFREAHRRVASWEPSVPTCECPRQTIGGGGSWFEHSHSCPCYEFKHNPGSEWP